MVIAGGEPQLAYMLYRVATLPFDIVENMNAETLKRTVLSDEYLDIYPDSIPGCAGYLDFMSEESTDLHTASFISKLDKMNTETQRRFFRQAAAVAGRADATRKSTALYPTTSHEESSIVFEPDPSYRVFLEAEALRELAGLLCLDKYEDKRTVDLVDYLALFPDQLDTEGSKEISLAEVTSKEIEDYNNGKRIVYGDKELSIDEAIDKRYNDENLNQHILKDISQLIADYEQARGAATVGAFNRLISKFSGFGIQPDLGEKIKYPFHGQLFGGHARIPRELEDRLQSIGQVIYETIMLKANELNKELKAGGLEDLMFFGVDYFIGKDGQLFVGDINRKPAGVEVLNALEFCDTSKLFDAYSEALASRVGKNARILMLADQHRFHYDQIRRMTIFRRKEELENRGFNVDLSLFIPGKGYDELELNKLKYNGNEFDLALNLVSRVYRDPTYFNMLPDDSRYSRVINTFLAEQAAADQLNLRKELKRNSQLAKLGANLSEIIEFDLANLPKLPSKPTSGIMNQYEGRLKSLATFLMERGLSRFAFVQPTKANVFKPFMADLENLISLKDLNLMLHRYKKDGVNKIALTSLAPGSDNLLEIGGRRHCSELRCYYLTDGDRNVISSL